MRTEFASLVCISISIGSFVGKLAELLGDEKTTRLLELSREEMGRVFDLLVGEDPTRFSFEEEVGRMFELLGEGVTKLFELFEGEMTKTVDGDPMESARAKLPIEPLTMD